LIQEISAGDSQDDAFPSTQDHVTEILLTQNSNQVSENHVSDITILSVSRNDQDSELPEASVNASTGTEVSEISDTNANDNKPQSLITALSDDELENFSDDDEFTNDNEEDGSFCSFSDDDDEGYYYDLNTSETYTKSNRSIYAY
ncbi:2164_t:CDS:2, partial [Racocetra fulgida]